MEIKNKPTVIREEGGEGSWGKEGEGTRQRTCMNDPETWTTVWELTMGVRGWGGYSRANGKKTETTVLE